MSAFTFAWLCFGLTTLDTAPMHRLSFTSKVVDRRLPVTSKVTRGQMPTGLPVYATTEAAPSKLTVTYVRCELTVGKIDIEVHHEWAPIGAKHFVDMVEAKHFDGCALFRAIKGFLVQFGIAANAVQREEWAKKPNLVDDPLRPEIPIKLGTMAYAGGGKNSRSTQIWIAFDGHHPHLGTMPWETPFAQVVGEKSLEAVRNINTEYGDSVDQGKIWSGYEYLTKSFPRLDYVKTCRAVPSFDGVANTESTLEPSESAPRPVPLHDWRSCACVNNASMRVEAESLARNVCPRLGTDPIPGLVTLTSLLSANEQRGHLELLSRFEYFDYAGEHRTGKCSRCTVLQHGMPVPRCNMMCCVAGKDVQEHGAKGSFYIEKPTTTVMPPLLAKTASRLVELGLVRVVPDYVLVNKYEAGHGIHPHVDDSYYDDGICGVTLGHGAVLDFFHVDDETKCYSTLLPPGAVFCMQRHARYKWKH
jgi:cyclophilin family peptidyl-prolyl cis-trans isomerase/alkylated DNA repair dioxygenase AlkB